MLFYIDMSTGEIGRAEFMKTVFGNQDRMDAWRAVSQFSIDPPEPFLQKHIREMTGLESSAVHGYIRALRKIGAIQEVEEPQSRGRLFVRVESPVWIVVAAAIEATQDMP